MDTPQTSYGQEQLLLGVDGGGSKTLAHLAVVTESAARRTVGCGRAGPSNPTAAGAQLAQAHIRQAVDRAFADAGLPVDAVAAACLALAGVGREPMRQEMLRWATSEGLARHVRVVHDAQAVLVAGTAQGVGVAIVCGTGSFAYGQLESGEHARSGGWGFLLGDEGSGYAIGNAALRAIVRAADGRGPATKLTEPILQRLELEDPAGLPHVIYSDGPVRRTVAALAPLVFTAADEGDEVATQICAEAALELARLVRSVARRLRLADTLFDLALAGGVLAHQPGFRHTLARALTSLHCRPRHTRVVTDPVSGALQIAHRAAAETI